MKGDRVHVVMDTGHEWTIEATKNGRRVEVTERRPFTEVREIMHTGTVVRTAKFVTARLLACVELPIEEPEATEPEAPASLFDTPIGPVGVQTSWWTSSPAPPETRTLP